MSDTDRTSGAEVEHDLIYDLGMHDGQDTAFYLQKGFRVVAVEANPSLMADAAKRFAREIADDRLILVNRAISHDETALDFYVNRQNSKWSSLDHGWGSRGIKGFDKITVTGRRLEDIVAEHGVPYYLKIDIEGADMVALQAVARFGALPKFASVEGGGENFLRVFRDLGYDRFCPVDQSRVPEMRLGRPAREGRFADYRFPMGASGPFGHEVDGPWMTFDEAVEERAAFRARLAELDKIAEGDQVRLLTVRKRHGVGWFDMHATTAETLRAGKNTLPDRGFLDRMRGVLGH